MFVELFTFYKLSRITLENISRTTMIFFFALSSLQGQLFSIPRVFIKKTEIQKNLKILRMKKKMKNKGKIQNFWKCINKMIV